MTPENTSKSKSIKLGLATVVGSAVVAVTATLEAEAEAVALLAREAAASPGARDLLLAGAVWLALVAGMHGIFALTVHLTEGREEG